MFHQHRIGEMNIAFVGNLARYLRAMSLLIALGSDHAGYELKEAVKKHLLGRGHVVEDMGTYSTESMDYPDPAHAVARSVASGASALGVLICGSGNGVSIAANRHLGVRCALAWNPEVARLARAHNDANVLALPARFIGAEDAVAAIDGFLTSSFEGGRHARRVEKIDAC